MIKVFPRPKRRLLDDIGGNSGLEDELIKISKEKLRIKKIFSGKGEEAAEEFLRQFDDTGNWGISWLRLREI